MLYQLSFPFSEFFHYVFKFFKVTPRMLTPNFILIMSAFEAIYYGWNFSPSVGLVRACSKIFKANNQF